MNDPSNIYAKTESCSGVYEFGDEHYSPCEASRGSLPGHVQRTGSKEQVHRCYRHSTICLSVLSAFLMAVTIALVGIMAPKAHYLLNGSSSSSEVNLVLTNLTNLTEQMRNLELEYSTCRSQRDSLATSRTTDTERISKLQQQLNTLRKRIEDTCPEGWKRLGSKIYFVSTGTNSWSSSRDDCRQKGADLVIINSREEQEFLKSLNKHVWIGLIEDKRNHMWKWVDDTKLTTRYWAPGEPNEYRSGEDCAVSLSGSDSLSSWNDERCHTSYAWVCERMVCNDRS